MLSSDEYEPLSSPQDAADLRRQRIGLVVFISMFLGLILIFLGKQQLGREETGETEMQAEMQFMEDFLFAIQNVAFNTFHEQGGLTRDQFEAAWSDYLESISESSPDFARTARQLWEEQRDLWGNSLKIRKVSENSEDSIITITVQPDPERPEFDPTAIFYANSWNEPSASIKEATQN